MAVSKKLQVVWFKRDFRIEDNECLYKASLKGPVLALFVFELELWEQSDTGYRHYLFTKDCVKDLQGQLKAISGHLNIYKSSIIEVFDSIHAHYGKFDLWAHQETGNYWSFNRDNLVRSWCKDTSVIFNEPLQFGVWRGSKVNRDTWAKDWDAMMSKDQFPIPKKIEFVGETTTRIPTAKSLNIVDDGIVKIQIGGRTEGLKILNSFLYDRGEFYRTDMSSPVTGEKGCSRLSPYIALGCVSMREVYQKTIERQKELRALPKEERGKWAGAVQSFIGRLHWHCHFTQKLELEPELQHLPMARSYKDLRPFEGIDEKLKAYEEGYTGYPFVDACMRYLKATGWINFRMRAMLMSFASYDLFVPWQKSGEILARYFTDYEAGIHWPQSQMQSGVTGINSIRIYSPIKQGLDQDPDGIFTRKWVPELDNVPDDLLQTPWLWEGKANYPPPIVDHKEAVKFARDKIWKIKKTPEAKEEAEAVYIKHGSRKNPARNKISNKKQKVKK